MQIFGIILNYVNITHIWLTKPLSEGVDHIDYYPLLLLNSAFIVKSAKILLIKRRFLKMIKNEVVNAIAERIEGAKKGDIALILETYAEIIIDTLKADATESVPVGKLGKFKVKTVPERRGKIMMGDRKGEEYVTPQHDEITFKMSKTVKQL